MKGGITYESGAILIDEHSEERRIYSQHIETLDLRCKLQSWLRL